MLRGKNFRVNGVRAAEGFYGTKNREIDAYSLQNYTCAKYDLNEN
jgi:hypothetical protein